MPPSRCLYKVSCLIPVECMFILVKQTVPVEIVVEPTDIVHFAGGNVSLMCSASGIPAPSIIWLKNGNMYTETSIAMISVEVSQSTNQLTVQSTLEFQELALSDDAEFHCGANNSGANNAHFQVSSRAARLTVQCK